MWGRAAATSAPGCTPFDLADRMVVLENLDVRYPRWVDDPADDAVGIAGLNVEIESGAGGGALLGDRRRLGTSAGLEQLSDALHGARSYRRRGPRSWSPVVIQDDQDTVYSAG